MVGTKASFEERRYQFMKDAINKQFEIAGHNVTFDDIVGLENDGWYNKYTITFSQHKKFKEWWIKEFEKRRLGLYKPAEYEFSIFDLMYGLKEVKDENKD